MKHIIQMDSNIITQCKNGDKSAFRWVVQKYQRLVFSLALKMLYNEEEAKDAVQKTFIRVWQHIENYDSKRNFATWVYTIATRLCLDMLKSRQAVTPLPEDEATLQQFASDTNSEKTLENREWVSIVKVLTEGLSPKPCTPES